MQEENTTSCAPPPGPHRFAGKRLVGALAIILLLTTGVAYVSGIFGPKHEHADLTETGTKYTCGMHPSIISDKPGNCPICGMALTKIEANPPAPPPSVQNQPSATKDELDDLFDEPNDAKSTPSKERTIIFYRNPMDPSITSPSPAKDEMGMDYVPVYSDEIGISASGSASVEGLATIRVGEEALRLSGVQTAVARRSKVERTVRTVGIVVADETSVRHVHTKVAGWIETLSTNFTGQTVKLGQPLLSIYSPELLASQEEFLAARQAGAKLAESSSPEIKAMGQKLLESARRRLELFDVPQSFIAELEKTGTVQRAVTLNAPVSGFVTIKGIFEGQQVEPGLELFTITDLSHVWIEADLYEYEAGAVEVGQEATLTLSYEAGKEFKGKVAYVSPYLSSESRTLKVRFDFPNPELKLKPQMYADVTLALAQAEGVTILDSAVIDTGVRQIVFVETAPGTFEPRAVKIGVRGADQVQIVAGIKEGEKVVVKANFLLDSESRLRAALQKMTEDGN